MVKHRSYFEAEYICIWCGSIYVSNGEKPQNGYQKLKCATCHREMYRDSEKRIFKFIGKTIRYNQGMGCNRWTNCFTCPVNDCIYNSATRGVSDKAWQKALQESANAPTGTLQEGL